MKMLKKASRDGVREVVIDSHTVIDELAKPLDLNLGKRCARYTQSVCKGPHYSVEREFPRLLVSALIGPFCSERRHKPGELLDQLLRCLGFLPCLTFKV